MVVIGPYGVACMQYSSDFDKKMRDEGYENPFDRQRAIFRKFTKMKSLPGSGMSMEIDEEGMNAADKIAEATSPQLKYISVNDWIQQREEYVAERIYENWPWDHFEKYVTDSHHQLEHLFQNHYPCRAADHQCSLFCAAFGNGGCTLKEE